MANVVVQPIVIPRWVEPLGPGEWRLHYYVVFTFHAAPPVQVPPMIKDAWPRLAASLFGESGPARLVIQATGGKASPLTVHRVGRMSDREPWDLRQATWLWQRIVTPVAETSPKATRSSSPLATQYKGKGPAVAINPESASDLRPAYRLESLDSPAVSAGMLAAHATLADRSRLEDAVDLDTLVALASNMSAPPKEMVRSLSLPKGADTGLGLADFVRALRGEIGLRRGIRSDSAVARARTEVSRFARIAEGGQNREPVERPSRPDFLELMARFRQHPGLCRRLLLTVPAFTTWSGPATDDGRVAFWIEDAEGVHFEPAVTAFELGTFTNYAGKRRHHFRPRPADGASFLGLEPGAKGLWLEFHLLPGSLYSLSQESSTAVAARAAAGYRPPPPRTPPHATARIGAVELATEDALRRSVNAINVYSRPPKSVAQSLDDRLRGTHAERLPTARAEFDARLTPRGVSGASARTLFAEDLIQGSTVFVRSRPAGTKQEFGPWESLCARRVEIYEPQPDGSRKGLVEFTEEAAVAASVMIQPKPLVGAVIREPTLTGSGADIDVETVAAEGKAGVAVTLSVRGPRPGTGLPDPTIYRGIFRASVTLEDVKEGDLVRAVRDRDGKWVAELTVIPPLAVTNLAPPKEQAVLSLNGAFVKRKEETFPLLLTREQTRFVNAAGKATTDPTAIATFKHIVIEGQRRTYAARRAGQPDLPFRALPELTSLGTDERPAPPDGPSLAGIVNRFTAAPALHWWHLSPRTDRWLTFIVPAPGQTGPWGSAMEANSLEQVWALISSPLTSVRGQVTGIGFELTAKLTKEQIKDPNKQRLTPIGVFFIADAPDWKLATTHGVKFTTTDATKALEEALKALAEGNDFLLVRLAGSATGAGGMHELTVTSYEVLRSIPKAKLPAKATDSDLGVMPPAFRWVLSVKTLANEIWRVACADTMPVKAPPYAWHPSATAKRWVEFIGVPSGRSLAARGWPQNLFGTLARGAGDRFTLILWSGEQFPIRDRDPKASEVTGFVGLTGPEGALPVYGISGDPSPRAALVAGEVTRVEVRLAEPAEPSKRLQGVLPGAAPGDVLIEISDTSGGTAVVRGAKDDDAARVPSVAQEIPNRPLRELELGEFVIARGRIDVKVGRPGWLFLTAVNKIWSLTTALVGRLTIPPLDPHLLLAEGAAVARPCVLTTPSGTRRTVWCDIGKAKDVAAPPGLVMVPAATLMLAETVSEYGEPKQKGADPVHAVVSELITRWEGWSLAVSAPGRADQAGPDAGDPDVLLDYRLRCFRPDLRHLPPDWQDWWRLPALRFDREYQFCLCRADLAGDHIFDEYYPPGDLPGAGFAWSGLLALQHVREPMITWAARGGARGADACALQLSRLKFTRADRPAPPLVAFAKEAFRPVDADRLDPKPGTAPDIAALNAASNAGLSAAAGTRDEVLCLVSDARTDISDDRDARAVILPPPCAVETIIMHGVLDGLGATRAAEAIGLAERYLDYTPPVQGADASGRLNYFGDPAAKRVALWLRSRGKVFPEGDPRPGHDKHVAPLLTDAELPHPSLLILAIKGLPYEPVAPGDSRPLLAGHPVEVEGKNGRPQATIALPPGVEAEAVFTLTNAEATSPVAFRDEDEWRSVSLVHVLNGPRVVATWERLEESIPTITIGSPPPTTRSLAGSVRADIPTTGWYKVTAFWNELWDEQQAFQFDEAELNVSADASGAIRSIRVLEGGFGYGTQAVAVVEPREPWRREPGFAGFVPPILEPVVRIDPPGNAAPGQIVAGVGRIVSVLVHDGGRGFNNETMRVRVLRRPAFHRSAKAAPCRLDKDGAILGEKVMPPRPIGTSEVEVIRIAPCDPRDPDGPLERGGYYMTRPFVFAHDPSGKGYGARLRAEPDGAGGVAYVVVEDGGTYYQEGTFLRFYTHRHEFTEQAIAFDPQGPPPAEQIAIALDHPVDTKGRRVDYVVELAGRHRKYLRPFTGTRSPDASAQPPYPPPGDPLRCRYQMPRISPPRTVDLMSTARPQKPSIAYLMPSFLWRVNGKPEANLDRARRALAGGRIDRLTVRRTAAVRVYLRRPWHGSGPEALGVVVAPSILNTVRQPGSTHSTVDAKDGGEYNVARAPEGDGATDPLEYHAIPALARGLVSRWGFDPAWADAALPALTIDHFPGRLPREAYEFLEEFDAAQPAVWLAVHSVAYDAAKELWYADVPIDLNDAGRPLGTNPFVQLAVAAYQENGLTGRKVSPVVQCDMIKLGGERSVEVRRSGPLELSLTVTGGFEVHAKAFPQRELIAELHGRPPALAVEVDALVGPHDPSGAREPLARYPLTAGHGGTSYQSDLRLRASDLEAARKVGTAVILLKEIETYPASEGRVDALGGQSRTVGKRMTAARVVFALTLEV